MDARDFAVFYLRLAAELRRIEANATPGWGQTPCGPRTARQVLPEVGFAFALFAAVTVRLVTGLTRVWVSVTVCGVPVVRGVGRTVRCARTLVT